MILNDDEQQMILKAIEDLFGQTQAKLLGRYFQGSKIYFSVAYSASPLETLDGMYRYAFKMANPSGVPNEKTIKTLVKITSDYIDSQKLKTLNQVTMDIIGADDKESAIKALEDNLARATAYMDMLLQTETRIVQAFATKDGILQVASSLNDADPTVCWRGVVDKKLCKFCRQMYHMPNNIWIPKAYRLSELKEGYFKAKEWDGHSPYYLNHPRCRHSISYIPKNFGFDAKGNIIFKHMGYDLLLDQRGVAKSEIISTTPTSFDLDAFIEAGFEHDHEHCDCGCH